MKILVTGGAGYIGSQCCKLLIKNGYEPIIVDNLINGHAYNLKWGKHYKIDISNTEALTQIILNENPIVVLHFASLINVGESVLKPKEYYNNNYLGTVSLLKAMKVANVNKIIFSSTCAVYDQLKTKISENASIKPLSPYAESKYLAEKEILKNTQLSSIIFRYFNASGADFDLQTGEMHNPETHLIPLAIRACLEGEDFILNGNDYNTQDGTCIRDYIHVVDLAEAHILALKQILNNSHESKIYNLGTAKGYSNLQIINCIEKLTTKKIKLKLGQKRNGDAEVLVADFSLAQKELGWSPQYDLDKILSTAIDWYMHVNKKI